MADDRIAPLARSKRVPLLARVSFNRFGTMLAGRVVGISHDNPMRYDIRLDDGSLVVDVPESIIDAVIDVSTARPKSSLSRHARLA